MCDLSLKKQIVVKRWVADFCGLGLVFWGGVLGDICWQSMIGKM